MQAVSTNEGESICKYSTVTSRSIDEVRKLILCFLSVVHWSSFSKRRFCGDACDRPKEGGVCFFLAKCIF